MDRRYTRGARFTPCYDRGMAAFFGSPHKKTWGLFARPQAPVNGAALGTCFLRESTPQGRRFVVRLVAGRAAALAASRLTTTGCTGRFRRISE